VAVRDISPQCLNCIKVAIASQREMHGLKDLNFLPV
jgi:hypothetical protein